MEPNILSIIPIVLTLALAVWTKNIIVSLFVGIFSGVMILKGGHPIAAIQSIIGDHIMAKMMDSYNVGIILLLVFIGGFVTLIENSGGAEAFARSVSKIVSTRRKTQLAAWLGGILIFFSELGTPLIVGPIFTPIFKKMRISKEKLAWIIDSTASPVCVLIPFIGWGVYSMGLIQAEFDKLNITEVNDWVAFCRAIPFQIYPILSLLIVPMVAFGRREFGAMAKAEQLAINNSFSEVENDNENKNKNKTNEKTSTDKNVSALVALIPLAVLFFTLFGILAPKGFPIKQVPGREFRIALITAYLFAAITMIILMNFYKVHSIKKGISIYLKGCGRLFDCIMMLILAWVLSGIGDQLGTPAYIVELATNSIPSWGVPAVIFIIASLISFATGTSWGTFAIVMPIAISMASTMNAPMYVTIGAVLSGGLFGDHCSPVSDTTILAATGSNCGLMEHMWTQLPYAGLCAIISIIGFIAAGMTDSYLVTVISIVLLFVSYYFASKIKGVEIKNLSSKEIEILDN